MDPRLAEITGLDWLADQPCARRLGAYALTAIRRDGAVTVLDVGCGPGSRLPTLTGAAGGPGRTLMLDISPGMLAEARRRGGPCTPVVAADARRLPLRAESVDAVWCERVLQHLPDPGRAVREMVRVVRPGGRIALIDTDWTTMTVAPGDPSVAARVTRCWADRIPSGDVGRQLTALLDTAGLGEVDGIAESFVGRDSAAPVVPPFTMFVRAAIDCGCVPVEEMRGWLGELLDSGRRGTFAWAVTMHAAVGVKPAA